jgi:hypothetical protein
MLISVMEMNHVERIQTLCLHLPGVSEVRDSQILNAPCLEYLDLLGLNIKEDLEEPLLPFKTPALRSR